MTDRTDPSELQKFHNLLMQGAPELYSPHYFKLEKKGKAPGVESGTSWKSEENKLTIGEAVYWMNNGFNIGISAREGDPLILVDIDDPSLTNSLKDTLITRSRSRLGLHGYYFVEPTDEILPANIPTDKGEVRSADQYVVAPGSYVPCPPEELISKLGKEELTTLQIQFITRDEKRGLYTVENDHIPSTITTDELPSVFKEKLERTKEESLKRKIQSAKPDNQRNTSKLHPLFQLEITDVAPLPSGNRDEHPLHSSETGKNWCINKNLGHCWRHLVSLNAVQYLVVKSGYMRCDEAGTAHHNSEAGPSYVHTDNGAIFHAWKQAVEDGLLEESNPPYRAMEYVADRHNLRSGDQKIEGELWKEVKEVMEEEYL